jgi:hypothetical protein
MVRPSRVIVTAVLAASDVPAVVITIDVAPGALMAVNVAPTLETAPVGVAVAAKKPAGYLSVMLLPAASSPPAVVVNENVAAAPVLLATLSDAEIENDVWLTWPPITPELTLDEAKVSIEVLTLTAVELAVAAPMVKPLIVTVKAEEELMVALDVLNTTEVLLVAANTMFKPCTLLAPAATTGIETKWDISTQATMIAIDFPISGHGSPNRLLLAAIEQFCRPLHMFSTI